MDFKDVYFEDLDWFIWIRIGSSGGFLWKR